MGISNSIRKKIVHKINHLSVVFYENNTNMDNIAVVEIHLSGNQEFIFLKRVTITYTSFLSYFVNWILTWFQNFLLICEIPYELGKNRIILIIVIIKYSFRKYLVTKPTTPLSSVQSLSRVRLCDPMNRSMPGLPVHHQLPEFTQTHIHLVSDAIQTSHPLSSPSPPVSNPSQHQSLFQWVSFLHEVARVLELHLQHRSLQRNSRADLLQNALVGSPCSPRDSQESSTPRFLKGVS